MRKPTERVPSGAPHVPISSFFGLWLLLAPAAAWAAPPDWPALLSPGAVASYIDGPVIVVEAGTVHPSRAPAAEALRASLTASQPNRLVMTGEALGDVGALSDDAIAEKAKHLPVSAVVTVRVFGYGGAATAVFAVLGRDGTRDGFSVARDQPLLSRSARAIPDAPQSPAPVVPEAPESKSVPRLEAPSGDLPPIEDAVREYRRNAIFMQEFVTVGVNTGRVFGQFGVPYKGLGEQRTKLEPEEFFSHVGRTDLERSYGNRRTSKIVLWSAGGLAFLSGTIMALNPGDKTECSQYTGCTTMTDYNGTMFTAGLSLIGVGAVVSLIPLFYSTSPVDTEELRQIGRDYNAGLRQKLGLPEDYDGEGPVPERRSPPPPKMVFGATPTEGGLFAMGTLTF